ncbi:MAG: LysR family transcriptional regulator [Ruminococcus sp.]|nr:LysR family transcriptional regulator [Ruminococcus sp.]
MIHMNSQQIAYVLAVAELQSFSKAAERLYVTQPSLSQYIQKLENQLGMQLFDRSITPVRLTEAGRAFVECAEQIQSLEITLQNRLADIRDVRAGSLKIGASSFRASCLLAQSVAEFRRCFEEINITIAEGEPNDLAEQIRSNELDVLIATGTFDRRIFHTEPLAAERLYLAVPQDSPLCSKISDSLLTAEDIRSNSMKTLTAPPANLSALSDETFVFADSGEYAEDRLRPWLSECGFTPRSTLRVHTLETLFSFVNAGFGIAFVPDSMIRFGNYARQPFYCTIDAPQTETKILLVSRRSGYFSRAAQEYCLLLRRLVDIGTWRSK